MSAPIYLGTVYLCGGCGIETPEDQPHADSTECGRAYIAAMLAMVANDAERVGASTGMEKQP